jgi:hypothetical protein
VRLTWALSFMEGARKLRASFICCVHSCLVGGALEEEGTSFAGTCWSEDFADLIGNGLRQHTEEVCVQGFLKQPKERSRVHLWSSLVKEGKGTLLGCILQGAFLHSLRGAFKVYRFHCIYFLVVFHT